jgi:hypothetical protein
MSKSRNEQAILDFAKRIEGTGASLREIVGPLTTKITTLQEQARSPQAVEPEDLTDELQALNDALSSFEQVGGALRGLATKSGGEQPGGTPTTATGEVANPGQGSSLPPGAPTEETGPGGVPTQPPPGDQSVGQSTVSGEAPTGGHQPAFGGSDAGAGSTDPVEGDDAASAGGPDSSSDR